MAKSSLPRNSSKLNLTKYQISLFQKMIYVGNQMVELLAELETGVIRPTMLKRAKKLIKKWSDLAVSLVNILI